MLTLPTLKHTTVIGFGHRARQGKDEAVRALEAFGAGRVRRFAIADALYAVCRVQHGMRVKDAPLLQRVGYEMRQRDEGVWTRACLDAIAAWDADAHAPQVACIPDIRFENEANAARELGHLIRIRRFVDGQPFVANDRPADHPSEIALQDYTWPNTIDNVDGDLLGFTLAVQGLAATLVPSVFQLPPGGRVYDDGIAEPVKCRCGRRVSRLCYTAGPCPFER
jgi:hypothetical protein